MAKEFSVEIRRDRGKLKEWISSKLPPYLSEIVCPMQAPTIAG
jgi:hypothetical protein